MNAAVVATNLTNGQRRILRALAKPPHVVHVTWKTREAMCVAGVVEPLLYWTLGELGARWPIEISAFGRDVLAVLDANPVEATDDAK